jgi:RimJ/RimL family protein N-acetyltransferase
LPDEDDHALLLHSTWGGKVFGQIADGKVVSWAAVKPLSDVVWDLSIETVPEHRGRGYARSAVSAALRHVFASGRLAGWGCDRTSVASLRTALSVGFRRYALDFGCVEVEQCGRKV